MFSFHQCPVVVPSGLLASRRIRLSLKERIMHLEARRNHSNNAVRVRRMIQTGDD